MSFGDDAAPEPGGVAPRCDLVVEALALVELMSASEYVRFVEQLHGAGVPKKLSRQLAAALEPEARSAEVP